MATTIPCPNPTCTHNFNQAELQAASAMQCPKCGFRLQGRAAPAPPAAPVSKPMAKLAPPAKPIAASKPVVAQPIAKPAKVAVAAPVQPQVKAAKPVLPGAKPIAAAPPPATAPKDEFDVEPDEEFDVELDAPQDAAVAPAAPLPDLALDTGALVRTARPKQKFSWQRLLIKVSIVGFATSAVVVGLYFLITALLGTGGPGGASSDGLGVTYTIPNPQKSGNEKVFLLTLPKREWAVETEIQARFGALAAWKYADEETKPGWFAVVVKDYVMHKPRDAEMLRTAVDKLESYYGEDMELGAKAEPAKVGKFAAQKIQFRGEVKSAKWLGECYMFFNNGIAYWLFVASPDWATVQEFAGDLSEKTFAVLSERPGWREQPLPLETFASENSKVSLTVPKAVWEKSAAAKNEDDRGELLLFGRYLREKDNRKNALVLVFSLDKKDNSKEAFKAAREHLDNKIKSDAGNNKIVLATEISEGQTEAGTVGDVGNRRGQIIDLKLQSQLTNKGQRYYLLAVVNEPDICYGILCECSWDSRQIWRQEFLEMLRTFTVNGK